jgi:Glycosyltransferase family 87
MSARSIRHLPAMAAALLPLLLTLAVAWFAWLDGPPARIDVGASTDGPYVSGFYDRERAGQEPYRWGRDNPSIELAGVPGPAVLMIRMAGRPGGVALALQGATQAPASFDVASQTLRRYQLLAATPASGGALRLTLASEAAAVPPEKRALTVLVDGAQLEPLRVASALPPLAVLPLLLACAACAVALPWMVSGRAWLGLLVGMLGGGGLALAWGQARPLVAPFLGQTAAGLLAVTALVLLMWAAARGRSATGLQVRPVGQADLLSCLLMAGGALPLWQASEYIRNQQLLAAGVALAILPLGALALAMRGRLRAILVALAVAATIGHAALQIASLLQDLPDLRSDFHALLRGAARHAYATLPLYNLTALTANPFRNTFVAPPAAALLLQPVATMPLGAALLSWRLASLALALLGAALLLWAYRARPASWAGAGMLMLIAAAPVVSNVADGQISLALLPLVALAWWGAVRGRDALWGGGLGAAAALNPALLPLLASTLIRGRWRGVLAGVVAAALITLLALAFVGATEHLVYLLGVLPKLLVSTSWVENQSLAGLVNRLYETDRLALQPGLGGVVQSIWLALSGVVVLATIWLTSPLRRQPADLTLALWSVAALLALPTSWIHYQILVIPIFLMLLMRADQGLAWPIAACAAMAWIVLGQGDRWSFFDSGDQLYGAFWQLLLSFKTYGLALLYLALAQLALRPLPQKPG